ncbi:DUF3987 domain-containing protein [Amycolatopsis sp. CA-230715]|uniref:DUF3987 domain-containing protein n=1 Tax=Amycolatopsis sp. CA-230715 TaxID=2745196 RepID=UPI001C3406B6|nr:DUF3987 domain-containing protein [Amycolatopsis sp. CA-230715]QWF80463.1 hypothetical protein HUW46_03885 [Amycolatopsis sp. CA-230715]
MSSPARALRALSTPTVPADASDAERHAAAEVARARAELPTLDSAVFDCYLGGLVSHVAPTSEADPVAVLASLLCAAGVALGQGPHVRAGDDPHPLLVWPLIVGRTSAGRKGTSWSTARRLIAAADADFHQDNIKSGLSSGEGLAERFAIKDEDEADTQGPRDLRLMVMESEWAGVMAKMKREGNSLSAILRAAWEGGDLSTLTVAARVAPSSHVGILAHITPQEFRDKVSASDLAGGTYNRFLPLAVARSKFLPFSQGAPADLVDQLGTEFAARLHTGANLGQLDYTEDAVTLWRDLYIEFSTDHGDVAAVEQFISRAVPNCLRIAAIHAALDGDTRIGTTHLTAAAALVRYSIASARAIFTDTATPARLAAWIAEAGENGRTRTDITRQFFKGRPPAKPELDALLEQLTAADTGGVETRSLPRADGRPGKGTTVYTARAPNSANLRT